MGFGFWVLRGGERTVDIPGKLELVVVFGCVLQQPFIGPAVDKRDDHRAHIRMSPTILLAPEPSDPGILRRGLALAVTAGSV